MSLDYERVVADADDICVRALFSHIQHVLGADGESFGKVSLANVDIRAMQELSTIGRRARDEQREALKEQASQQAEATPMAKPTPPTETDPIPAADRDFQEQPMDLEEAARIKEYLESIVAADDLARSQRAGIKESQGAIESTANQENARPSGDGPPLNRAQRRALERRKAKSKV